MSTQTRLAWSTLGFRGGGGGAIGTATSVTEVEIMEKLSVEIVDVIDVALPAPIEVEAPSEIDDVELCNG